MKKFLISTFLIYFSINLVAQDPVLTGFQYSKLEYNPSYGGSDGIGKVAIRIIGKTSFHPIRGPFNYSNFSIDYSPCQQERAQLGLGLIVSDETQGDGFLKMTKIGLNAGLSIKIADYSSLSIGFRPNIITQKIDWNEFTFSDQLDPIRGITNVSSNQNANLDLTSVTNWDLGIRYNNFGDKKKYFMIGLGIFNAFEPKIGLLSVYQLPRRLSFQFSLIRNSKRYEEVSYHFYSRFDLQNNFKCFAFNFEAYLASRITFGLGLKVPLFNQFGVKNNLFPSVLLSYQVNPVCKIYYCWEPNILSNNIGGKINTHEIGIVLITAKKICSTSDLKDVYKFTTADSKIRIGCPSFKPLSGNKIESF